MSRDIKHTVKVASISLLVAFGIVLLSWQAFFNQVNDIAYDFTLRLAGPVDPASSVQIVAIDEESLDRVGAWPWSRSDVALLVAQISAGEPRAIGIDFLLDDPRDSGGDRALAAAIAEAGNVVLATRIDDAGSQAFWRMPLEIFESDSVRLGHAHADPDLDGVVRRIVTAKEAEGEVVRALSVEVLRVAGELPPDFEEAMGGSVRIVPEALLLRFAGDRGTFAQVSAWQVLEGAVDRSTFEDRIVLIGATADGLGDDWMTPVSTSGRRMSGIEIHANALDSIYAGRSIQPLPDLIVWLGVAALIGMLYWADNRFEGKRFYVASALTIPLLIAASDLFLRIFGIWLPFPTFLAALGFVVPALEVRKLVRVNRDLDQKISTLSVWAAESPESGGDDLTARATWIDSVGDSEVRQRWIGVIESYEQGRSERHARQAGLLGAQRHDAPWKLEAVDFFNEQLYRFVSFNKAVLASIEDVILVSDPAGRIVYQNPAAERIDGYLEDAPAAWEYLSGLLDGRAMLDDFAGVFSSEEPHRLESVPSMNGLRFYTLTLAPIADIGVVATLHDVTAQRDLDQAKSDMVSLVSHELRTPLTSIRGYGDMLAKYGLVEAKGADFLQSILSETDRLSELIQSFLDIATIEAGRKKLDVTDFESGSILTELIGGHRQLAEQKEILLEMGDRGGTIRGDRMLLYQALANLVSNALKYSPPGTRVIIDTTNGNGRFCFRVEDQGYGIPTEDADRVFEKFYRRSNRETREENGFGLGLPFVREVATQHGGDVTLESRPGQGSVFSLWIPV